MWQVNYLDHCVEYSNRAGAAWIQGAIDLACKLRVSRAHKLSTLLACTYY